MQSGGANSNQVLVQVSAVSPGIFSADGSGYGQGYAVTQSPVNVSIDGFYANGVSAVMGPVTGLPGSVYQITVYVPNPASLVANNPNLLNFRFPPQVPVTMQIAGATTQNGIAISIAQ